MLASLLVATVAQQSLFQQVIKKPTGNNGYEEYVQAADIALASRLQELQQALTAPEAKGTLFERQKAVANQCAKIVTLVKQGNEKQLYYPGDMTLSTSFPEIGPMRHVGLALVTKAQVDFAEGRVNQGLDTLLTALTYGERISFVGPLIFDLIGRVITQSVMRSLNENMAMVSLPSAWEIQRAATRLLETDNPWTVSIRLEMEVIVPEVASRLKDPKMFKELVADESLASALNGVSQSRMSEIAKEVEFGLTRHYSELLRILELPESQWVATALNALPKARPQDEVAGKVFDALVPTNDMGLRHEIVRRTHLRLLRVVGAVVEYRWTNGYFPGSLDALREPSLANDPLTGGKFHYERAPGSFALYSEGTAETGRIGLDWALPRS
jgi:hypothetical protein